MSITPTTQHFRPLTAKGSLAAAAVFGLLGGPVALASPAVAETSLRGCTVGPLEPRSSSSWDSARDSGEGEFRIRVECNGNRTVQIKQLRFEDDAGKHDDFLGHSTFWVSFDNGDRSVTLHSSEDVEEGDEVYQLVSFRVRSGNSDNWSDWTDWEKSDVATIGD
jgi:hypothetical protein